MAQKTLKVLVTGPTGMSGRVVVAELLQRGHHVTGFSKHPEKYGTHPRYTAISGSQTEDVENLRQVVEGHDVVINCFAPSHAATAETYIGLVEGAWRLKDAVKAARSKPYFIYVGGAGSLVDPETNLVTLDEAEKLISRCFINSPIEYLAWLADMIGARPFHWYYQLREWGQSSSYSSFLPRLYTSRFEKMLIHAFKNTRTMPHACRAAASFFEHDESFDWSFLSPPWFYRAGPRTAEGYWTTKEYHPTDSRGRWLGINTGDFALAVVDEAENRSRKWVHWSCFGKQPDVAYFYDGYKDLEKVISGPDESN